LEKKKRLVKMKEKILAILPLILVAMSITGYTYAQWNDTVVVSNTMTFGQFAPEIGFVHPLECMEYHTDATGQLIEGEYEGKEVGDFQCDYDDPIIATDAYDRLAIGINNAYPGYEVHCNFTLTNIATYTVQIVSVNITDPNSKLAWQEDPLNPVHYEGIDIRGLVVVNLYLYEESAGEPLKGITLNPDDTKPCVLIIEIEQDAEESTTYNFQIEIMSEMV
jgi:hypothetical protein